MSKFNFKNAKQKAATNAPEIKKGVHVGVITQAVCLGMQRPYGPDDEPVEQLGITVELEGGQQITKNMKYSGHPMSKLYDLFMAALPDEDDLEFENLLGKSVLIEVELYQEKWPKITNIMSLEDGFAPVTTQTELIYFDVEQMNKDQFLKLHKDQRNWISKRIR